VELDKGIHGNIHLQNAYDKYGANAFIFEVLYYCKEYELTEYEQAFVNIWKPRYNIRKECVDSQKGVVVSEETKMKLRNANLGKKLTEYTKRKISEAGKGRVMSEVAKAKISVGHKGVKVSEATRLRLASYNAGRIVSEETKAKMSASNTGKHKMSEETRHKLSEAAKKQWHNQQ
jgi:group I intron endonuclease